MRVADVMSRAVQKVAPGTAAEEAWQLMRLKGIHHLVVADATSLVGVISTRDAGGRQGASVRRNRTVADLMTPDVVTVPPDMTVRKAANLMRGRSIGCLIVTDESRVVGIITVADLLLLLTSLPLQLRSAVFDITQWKTTRPYMLIAEMMIYVHPSEICYR